jgi:hypothetical protein
LAYNHDAGQGAVVGAYGHPASTIGNNWLGTRVGDAKHQREGDSIYSKYIDYAFSFNTNSAAHPCVSVRILIVKGTGNNANDYSSTSISDWFVTDGTNAGSGNLLTQQVDTTKYTVLKDVIVYAMSSGNGVTVPAVGIADRPIFPVVRGRLKTGYKVQYVTGTEFPSKSNHRIQMAVIPYGNQNCSTAQNLLNGTLDLCHYFCDM